MEALLNESFNSFNQTCENDVIPLPDLFGSFGAYNQIKWLISRLRIFLYLSDPYEESFEFVHQVADYHTETLPILVGLVFLEWFVLWLQGKSLPLLGDSATSAAMIINMEVFRILCRGMEHGAYFYIYHHFRIIDLPWNSPLTWYIAAIFVDFCYYWGHRASHVIHALWAHHQAHHSNETYSLVNVFRLPFTQEWLYAFSYLPMALVVPPTHYLVHHQLNLLYQFWLHTEVISKIGPLEWIFNTPSHHRVHHGSNPYCLDKNFGAWLIIWDRMFGTFQEELPDVPIVYGLVDPVRSFNPVYLQVFYYGKLYDKWKSMVGWKNKIFSLVKGPGWRPGSPWTGFIEEVPDVSSRKKYEYETLPIGLYVYLAAHFVIHLAVYQAISVYRDRFSTFFIVCHLAYVVLGMANTGMFIDRNPATATVEFIRCAIVVIYTHYEGFNIVTKSLMWSGLTDLYGVALESTICMALSSFFFASTLVWGLISGYQTFEKSLNAKNYMQ